MPNINAALLVAQLENFEKIRDLKRKLFNKYLDFFKDKNIILKEPPMKFIGIIGYLLFN